MTRICPPEGEACYPLIPTEDDASVPTRPTTPAPTRGVMDDAICDRRAR